MKNYTFFIILIFSFLSSFNLNAQCSDGYEQRVFDWEPAHWQDAVLSARDYAVGGTNMTIWFSGSFNRDNPRDFSHFNSATYGGWSFIDGSENLEMSGINGTSQSMHITFDNPVENLQFSIYDIDNMDVVSVTGSASPTLTSETATPTFSINGNQARSTVGENLGTSNTTLNVEFTEPVSEVTITLEESNTITAFQWIGITDMRMCVPDVIKAGNINNSNTKKLDWTSLNYDPNKALQGQTFSLADAAGGTLIDVQLLWEGATSSLTKGTNNSMPGYFQDQKGTVATDDGLEILADPNATGSTVKLTVNFLESGTNIPAQVKDLRFSIYDIDNSVTPGGFNPRDRRDKVTLSGAPLLEADSDGSTFGIYGNMIIGTVETHADGNDGNGGSAGATEPNGITGRGTVNVYYPGNTSSFTLEYTEAHTFAADPSLRGIELSDLIFSSLILPVDLLSFEAEEQEKMVELNWSTLSEINNELFEVMHSVDGRYFESIGEIDGYGNSNKLLNYSYMHKNPISGTNYYKLRQIDYDGKSTESDIVSVTLRGLGSRVNAYPNPTTGIINVESESEFSNVKILNAMGVVLLESSSEYIDISHYPTGIYYLQVFESGNKVHSQKLIKQ